LVAFQLASPSTALATDGSAESLDLGHAAANSFIGWWKSRRTANGGAKLLAPIYVARQRLQQALDMLSGERAGSSEGLKEVLQLVRSSSLNCYMFEALDEDTIETRAR